MLVKIKCGSYTSMTDDKGNFELKVSVDTDQSNCVISWSKEGFESAEMKISDLNKRINITIYPVKKFVEPLVTGKVVCIEKD